MARKIFQRFTIDRAKLLESGSLSALGTRIYDPNLWHFNRHSVSRAFLAGMFAGFTFILFPGQMLIAALLAIWLRGNLPIACGLCWLTNPVTSPPILYLALKIGLFFIPVEQMGNVASLLALLDFDWSIERLTEEFKVFIGLITHVWQPLLLGCFIIGSVLAFTSYFLVQAFWRWHVTHEWKQRKLRRQDPTDI